MSLFEARWVIAMTHHAARIPFGTQGRFLLRALLIAGCVGLWCSRAALANPTTAELVDANATSVRLWHRFHLAMVDVNRDQTGEIYHSAHWWWSRNGEQERIRLRSDNRALQQEKTPTKGFLSDVFMNGSIVKTLDGWDADKPPKLEPYAQGTVRAYVERRTQMMPALIDPGRFLHFSFALEADLKRRLTLAELVRISPKVEMLGKVLYKNWLLYQIRIAQPRGENVSPKSYYDVFLDPDQGYWARAVVEHVVYQQPGAKTESAFERHRWIEAFDALGDGLFMPRKVWQACYSTLPPVQADATSEMDVERQELTEELAGRELGFRFPKNVLVLDVTGPNGREVQLWGDNDAPLRTIADEAELLPPAPTGFRAASWLLYGAAPLLLLIIGWLIRRNLWT